MSPNAKLWVARVISIPVIILLPFMSMIPGLAFRQETRGDSIPFGGMLAFAAGLAAAIIVASRILFAARGTAAVSCFKLLAIVACCEATLWLLAIIFVPFK